MTERQYRARERESVRRWRSDWQFERAKWNAVNDAAYIGPNFFRLQGLFESGRDERFGYGVLGEDVKA